ncbi:tryptophan synthase beta subunit-like PLP-dependent enzyme [Mucor mucedo]|uniref:tryptophan synthase beta subunit-like PLP-dependent enzyme n=1 Tax=Mucor mucedo TaxID=29922 RepID=UPI00221F85F4|nr:tryptophan synthase beta subunit-like PLP-dependent enzyme [Mucor mucedo]KAI7893066.1 tryptophan synthase beta subunit-like PLP-dependent enzyme [Mucor mucedo]
MSPSTSQALVIGLLSGAAMTVLATGLFSYWRPETKAEEVKHEEEMQPDIVDGVAGLIGNTPLMKIKSLSEATGCLILFLNPGGSSKDRVALNMIKTAEESGILKPHTGSTVFEGTVGSTGISIAMIARAKGYKAWIVMPDDQAVEKYQLLEKLGATVEKVRPCSIIDKKQFVNLARERASKFGEGEATGYFADQFENEANFQAHYTFTGPEIYRQTAGKIDALVLGAGTGGTLSGITCFLKEHVKNMKVFLADPQGSGLYNKVKYNVMYAPTEQEGNRRRHQVDTVVEGIGINRLTQNFDRGRRYIDDAFRVTDEEAIKMSRYLVREDGNEI